MPDAVLVRAVRKMESLGENPRPAGCKKLKGYRDLWRIRVGDWRILYLIDDGAKLVSVTRIAHRREVCTTECLQGYRRSSVGGRESA